MLRNGRKWFAPFYGLGIGLLFYAFSRIMNMVHTLSQEDAPAAQSLRAWVLGIGIFSGMLVLGLFPSLRWMWSCMWCGRACGLFMAAARCC